VTPATPTASPSPLPTPPDRGIPGAPYGVSHRVGERPGHTARYRSAQRWSSAQNWTLDQQISHAGEVLSAVTPTRDRTIMLSETSQTEQSCYAGRPRSKAAPLRLSWTCRHAGPPAAVLGAAQPLPPHALRLLDATTGRTLDRATLPSRGPLLLGKEGPRFPHRSRPAGGRDQRCPHSGGKEYTGRARSFSPLVRHAPGTHCVVPLPSLRDGQACVCPRSIAAGMVVKVFVGAGERVAQLTDCEATCGGGHPLGGGEFTPTGDTPRHSGRPWKRSQPVIHHTRPPTPRFADPVTSHARSSAACGSPRPHTADAERTPMPRPALPMPGSGRAAGGGAR
jgi:hypothetical protein